MTSGEGDLEATYLGYETSGRSTSRWSEANPGNQRIHDERNRSLQQALERCASQQRIGRLLEVGCGGGALLRELAAMPDLHGAAVIGIDVLAFRLAAGHALGGAPPMAQADGQQLPFPAGTFDVVALSTVLSSVRDDVLAAAILTEVDRVLRIGGSVLWYDMRYPNPANPSVRPVRRRDLRKGFPGYRAEIRSVTVVPQLARRLGRATRFAYRPLSALPLLRSHLVGRLIKPG